MPTKNEKRAAQRELLLDTAIAATLAVLEDPAAPPTAKSSAAATAARLYEFLREADVGAKDLADMTYEELMESIHAMNEILAEQGITTRKESKSEPLFPD